MRMRDRITGSKALMRALKAEGVETIFGYPGGSIMPVYDALFDYTRGEKKCFDHIMPPRAMPACRARWVWHLSLAALVSPTR